MTSEPTPSAHATFTVTHHAAPGERFAATAFDSQIGKVIAVNLPGGETVPGRLLGTVVSPDGTNVKLTVVAVTP